jgi:hypothetical protein
MCIAMSITALSVTVVSPGTVSGPLVVLLLYAPPPETSICVVLSQPVTRLILMPQRPVSPPDAEKLYDVADSDDAVGMYLTKTATTRRVSLGIAAEARVHPLGAVITCPAVANAVCSMTCATSKSPFATFAGLLHERLLAAAVVTFVVSLPAPVRKLIVMGYVR